MFSRLLEILRQRGAAPAMSATERAALEAGDTWIEAELFSGRPDLERILAEPYPELEAAERAFLDGPVEEVCRLAEPTEIARTGRLPEAVWVLLRRHRFFGLGLPVEYGGHAFSPLAQSTIFGKLASRSLALSTVVLIPNSVGPGELLLEVGTADQRQHYLPRLARGDEIPCFALTEPEAGSDAASITSRGVLFERAGELMIRLDWEKRYITLAPIATLLGLAFRLYDPEGLLGGEADVGISVALVPTNLPGVEIGATHDPMGIPFPNGPTRGRGVVISASSLIGGLEQAGRGWRMLMEALSGGRAISLPAQAVAGAKWVARVAGAYSFVRRQFGLEIGRFEGVEERLARVFALTYLMEAARVFTCGAVAGGRRPAVVSAIVKYNSTELLRSLVADGMDVLGGAALCRGPRNLMAEGWIGAPIGITVEGANILTRTLIVFGQGALRCHPHAFRLLEAVRRGDVRELRSAFGGQVRHGVANAWRCLVLGSSRGRLARSPVGGRPARYWRRLAWASARFALTADLAMALLGGGLKFRGKLTGRFADMLSWMYLATAALRRFEAEGRQQEDLPLVEWALEESLGRIQESYEGILQNFGGGLVGAWLRGPALWWARLNPMGSRPGDRLGARVVAVARFPGDARERLLAGLFTAVEDDHALAALERAFVLCAKSAEAEGRIRRGQREGLLAADKDPVEAALAAGIISASEAELVRAAQAARREAIQVDSFPATERIAPTPV